MKKLLNENYFVSTDPADMEIDTLHRFLTLSYWAMGRTRETVEKTVQNSICCGIFEGDKQIGFARAITDRTTFAYLADVFVLEPWRGKGLCRRMLDELFAHPELIPVKWMLMSTDAQGLYRKFGFTTLRTPERLMERPYLSPS